MLVPGIRRRAVWFSRLPLAPRPPALLCWGVVVLDYDLVRPWVRQPCDTDLSWVLFQEFLSAPLPRRLADLARKSVCPLTWHQLESVAFEDGWKDRAAAWDRHLDALRTTTIERVVQEDAKQRAERQGRAGKKLQRLGELEIDKLIKVLERPDDMPGAITLRDAIRAIGIGVRVERLALGESTDKIETGPDLSKLSLDELRKLREIQEKTNE